MSVAHPIAFVVVQQREPERTATMSWIRSHAAFASAFAVLLVGGVIAAAIVRASHDEPHAIRLSILPNGPPLAGGEKMSLAEAEASFPLPIFRPDVTIASDGTIEGLWVRTEGDAEVYIRYDSGIIVTVRPAHTAQSTDAFSVAQINDGVPGEIASVAGVDAFVVPQSAEGDLGSVRFDVGRAIVTVIGHGDFDVESLTSVAASIVTTADAVAAEAT